MLYSSSTLSLACLEVLVHIKEPRLPADYGWVENTVPANLMDRPLRTADSADEDFCRRFGSGWVLRGRRPVVRVPSAIIPSESNFLLNAEHSAFPRLSFSEPEPFRFRSTLAEARAFATM